MLKTAPESFEGYREKAGVALESIAGIYGIVKVACQVFVPSGTPFAELVADNMVLFQKGEREAEAPISFSYIWKEDGRIAFHVYIEKEKSLTGEEKEELEILFRQLYYILESLILSDICRRLTMTDQSTGMANITAFFEFADRLIAQGKVGQYTAFYFNIRNFKSVYKALSYVEGDKVLAKYCRIVANAVTERELVARLGGDNFVALILDENRDYFLDLIQNILVRYEKDGQDLVYLFGASIGVAKLAEEKDAGDIMMHISVAYQSALENRSLIGYYNQAINHALMERKIILSQFAKALNEKEFFPLYQPKVEVKTHRLMGAEALVRWRHGSEFVMPGSFIPVLEKDGCITALDFYMLEEACRFIRRLDSEGIEPVKISVNFSKRHLVNNKLVEEIADTIDRYRVPHKYIQIELTESEDYHNQSVMRSVVDDLDHLGIKTSIDDFGTGYSSLGMLKSLRIDELKIDRSFIPHGQLNNRNKSLLMLKGVVNLANSLGLTIVAEGVETLDQLALIESMGCDIVQGYIFDKPLTESEFIERIRQQVYVLDGE